MEAYQKIATFLLLFLNFAASFDYCNLKNCKRKHHIACTGFKPSASSGSDYKILKIINEMRRNFLDKHNELRNNLALGKATKGDNIHVFSYSMDLEYVAQCWANQCYFGNDKCKLIQDFQESVSQNIGTSWPYPYLNPEEDAKTLAHDLYEETEGHFSQMMWAKTTRTRCGRITYKENGFRKLNLVCNYSPSGNYLDKTVYLHGKACSKCGNEKCNEEYLGLCSEIDYSSFPSKNNTVKPKINDKSGDQGGQKSLKNITDTLIILFMYAIFYILY